MPCETSLAYYETSLYFLQLCIIECIIFNVILQAFRHLTRMVIYLFTYFESINDM